ncbi:hypothetical protein HNY73_012471 [Argiope bruennichi]|uniref:Uncharacterized protein n=1 Tax=Argiope bruennichi TaxID=94029 RepID=A0A8T0EV02_ARGBR|nr:hypothetical protein HNY73_012471 [Argiope bruennichi]
MEENEGRGIQSCEIDKVWNCSTTSKKQYVPAKSSFLSSSFFEKSSINSVLKPLTGSRETSPNPSGLSSKSKLKKDCKLMKAEKSKREPESEEYEEDEDDWCVFHYAGGYQRVKSGAD